MPHRPPQGQHTERADGDTNREQQKPFCCLLAVADKECPEEGPAHSLGAPPLVIIPAADRRGPPLRHIGVGRAPTGPPRNDAI
jgi:hypothetical protein